MPVDELQLAVGKFPRDQRVGVSDLREHTAQRGRLRLPMQAPVF
jgi:hypothetical protein